MCACSIGIAMLMPHQELSHLELANTGLVYLDSGEVDEYSFQCQLCNTKLSKLNSLRHFTGHKHGLPAEEVFHRFSGNALSMKHLCWLCLGCQLTLCRCFFCCWVLCLCFCCCFVVLCVVVCCCVLLCVFVGCCVFVLVVVIYVCWFLFVWCVFLCVLLCVVVGFCFCCC